MGKRTKKRLQMQKNKVFVFSFVVSEAETEMARLSQEFKVGIDIVSVESDEDGVAGVQEGCWTDLGVFGMPLQHLELVEQIKS
jgi:hypothetical protein